MFESLSFWGEVTAIADAARPAAAAGSGTVSDWVDLTARLQRAINTLTAVQDLALARVAASDVDALEDGTLVDVWTTPGGEPRLDAPALVASALGVGAAAAETRVRDACRLVHTLPALHDAMRSGVLDRYRARVVSDELENIPTAVAAQAAAIVASHVDSGAPETRARLQRRVRAAVAGIDPDLVIEQQKEAAKERRFERWSERLGQDTWRVTFPADKAAPAYAAIDTLARQYRRDGVAATLDQARADALIALVMGQATVEYQLHLAVPADALLAGAAGVVEVRGFGAHPITVTSTWLTCHPTTGAPLDPSNELTTEAYRPGAALRRLIRMRDGHCRFPGCTASTYHCDLDHVRAWPQGPTSAENLMLLCRRHHRIKQRLGWRVKLDPDGTATWADPLGQQHVTFPVDHLDSSLNATATRPPPTASETPAEPCPDEDSTPVTLLEAWLDHATDAARHQAWIDSAPARRAAARAEFIDTRHCTIPRIDIAHPTPHQPQVRLSKQYATRPKPPGPWDHTTPPF